MSVSLSKRTAKSKSLDRVVSVERPLQEMLKGLTSDLDF
jgi:hypothetical protein